MVNFIATIPMFIPLDIPEIPEPFVEVDNRTENWWYKDERSDWVVVEDCWSIDKPHPQWWALENSIRSALKNAPASSVVPSDLDWTYNGLCIRLQGLQSEVLRQRQIYIDVVMSATIDQFPLDISTLDQKHLTWVYQETEIPRVRQQIRIWQNFWEEASLRTIYSSQTQFPLEQPSPLPNKKRLWFPMIRNVAEPHDFQKESCNTQVHPEFPQVAVTIEARYEELTSSEKRIVSAILGDGVRSRLSQRLREELGLVYNIGARFNGDAIRIDFTVDPIHLIDSLKAIRGVLLEFSQMGPSAKELETARSMFLLRQYEILEDPATFVRMAGRFTSPNGWENYIQRTVSVFNTGKLESLTTEYPDLHVWMTGPLNHPEVLTTDISRVSQVCSILRVDRN